MTSQSTSQVGWHIRGLRADGTIKFACAKRVGSAGKYYYRAPEVPSCDAEQLASIPPENKKALVGFALQASLAEALAAFWAGAMVPDKHVVLAWRWFNVDGQGRTAIADEQERSWARLKEIASNAVGRAVESTEIGSPILVASMGYLRSRSSPFPPAIMLDPMEGAIEMVTSRLGQGERGVEEALSYAISDRLRIEILTILNEGDRNRYELAASMGEEPEKIKHHLKELLDEGSIELACSKRIGNVMQNYYRAIRMPSYSADEYAAMPPESRQAIAGVALQGVVTEALSALRAGTIIEDRRSRIAWGCIQADARGRKEITEEQERSWERMQEIEAEALNRVAESGESTMSILVSSLGFVRSRRPSFGGASPGTDGSALGGFDLGSPTQPAEDHILS